MWERLQPTLAAPSLHRLLRLQMTAVVEPEDVARAALDKVEKGGGHVVLPRRMTPILALAWAPRSRDRRRADGVRGVSVVSRRGRGAGPSGRRAGRRPVAERDSLHRSCAPRTPPAHAVREPGRERRPTSRRVRRQERPSASGTATGARP